MTRILSAVVVLCVVASLARGQQTEIEPTRRAALLSIARPEHADDAAWQREIGTHAAMISHDATMMTALGDEKSPIRATKWFTSQPDAVAARQWLHAHLRAEPLPNTRLIRVYLDDQPGTPSDHIAILETIVNTYIAEQQKIGQSMLSDRMAALNSLKTKYEIRVRELSDRRNNLMLRMNIGQPGTSGVYTTTDLELREAMKRESELRAAEAGARTKYSELEAAIKAGKDPQAVVDVIDRDPEMLAIRARLIELEADLAVATGANDSGASRSIGTKRDAIQSQLDKRLGEKLDRARAAVLAQAESDARAASIALEITRRTSENLKGIMGDLAIAMSDYLSVTDELTRTESARANLRDQLDRLANEMKVASGAVQWAQHPSSTAK